MMVLTRKGYHQGRKIQMKMVMTEGEEREAGEENRGREARSGRRRQFEQARVGIGIGVSARSLAKSRGPKSSLPLWLRV